MKTRCLEINGLTVELVHQPDASQAAALIQVGAGESRRTRSLARTGASAGTSAVHRQHRLA
ncbi:hypothetical protein [Pantoea sp. 1B4]|uniref:hypothetical protein n=1 Tax=Pantoea sp. 1B4 TaxID=2804760 RepID=UPI002D7EC2A6|nr:hypothetical protein [Pantoea sp. 1B4]MCX2200797.1 hypothetical protein [Pantoea agglomerans]